ncbi:MAG: orotate phosphoribosyltransferase-like protein [Euryarchaeota archaeon RBG_19FT_COMBO_56_21]|nr:MAG: orotate phosphoribosyltransferase-like protein [Euryarchaeota archaeon RBG_19FT_COMBO_56_21]
MVDVKELAANAKVLRKKGLGVREIADELHLSVDTVNYLIEYGAEGLPPSDVKIGWRSVGVSGFRIGLLSELMADMALEELAKKNMDADVVLGISINGVPFATMLSEIMGLDFAVYRPHAESELGGAFSSNFSSIGSGKKIIVVDDVLSTGATIKSAIADIKEAGGNPVLVVVIVNKSSLNEIDGVTLRGLIRARSIGGTILGGSSKSFPYG